MDFNLGTFLQEQGIKRRSFPKNNYTNNHIYHVWGLNNTHIPGIHTSVQEEQDYVLPLISKSTESRDNYVQKPIHDRVTACKSQNENMAVGIVPATDLTEEVQERMLPVVSRQQVNHMTTFPFLQYSGAKKKTKSLYTDSGFVYPDSKTTPRYNDQYWTSVTSLNGLKFSKRRAAHGPKDQLPVLGFDGGGEKDIEKGIRCGYPWSFSSVNFT